MSSSENPDLIKDGWQASNVAEKYARAEAATRPFADIFLSKARLPSAIVDRDEKINALDLACGTGAVTASLYESLPKEKWSNVKVLAGDISNPMLSYLKVRGEKAGWPGLTTQIVDGADIKLEKEQFTHIFANAIIFLLPLGTLHKLHSLLQPNGFIGMTTWATLGWYDLIARALSRLPSPPPLIPFAEMQAQIQQENPWHEVSFVRQQLQEAGFKDVDIVREKKKVPCGTPEQFLDAISMPLALVSSYWEEGVREQTLEDLKGELRKVVVEEAGGEGREIFMEMEGIVSVGWKR